MTRRLILKSFQSPGDVVMLTAAVRDLHAACPGQFQTDVRTSVDALWENNPHITRLKERDAGVESLDMHYPLIHQSNQRPYHFIHGYPQYLEQQLGVHIPLTKFHGDIHLNDEEKAWSPKKLDSRIEDGFWIIIAGGKYDFTAKWWNPASYQAVVDHYKHRIQFVQCGEEGHWHPRLDGVIDLVGKTSARELVRLMYHAAGVVCPTTFAMHLAAAVETRRGLPQKRPCVVIGGGREPVHWEAYPGHQFISTCGALSCCQHGGCWKSRCQLVGDGDPKDRHDVCEQPVQVSDDLCIPRCMEMITPAEVIRRVDLYFQGGALSVPSRNGNSRSNTMQAATATTNGKSDQNTKKAAEVKSDVLIKFRHGLGDSVQLTVALQHFQQLRPQWNIDIAALPGKHSAFVGLCRRVFQLDRDRIDDSLYRDVVDLDWRECHASYGDSPSTKAERYLRENVRIEPVLELCRYQIKVGEEARQKARRYLERICKVSAGEDGRFPVVLIHYEGNTSAEYKNLPHTTVRELCDDIIRAGSVPVILDWDRRSPLPDNVRIFNPHADMEIWGELGTGDAETLAALIEMSALMIGVDSGPLHVAGATNTPTIGVWTRHHPVHYFSLADNVTHLVPQNHAELLRGEKEPAEKFFHNHYRIRTYEDLQQELRDAVAEQLQHTSGGLVYTRNFWIRSDNAQQDLVVVQDIAEHDSYRVGELPMARPLVVDVGAHIGCFSSVMHEHNPLARIVAVECCPENITALKKNVGGFAKVVQAAVTYEQDVALMNAVFRDCETTGGSILVDRELLRRKIAVGELTEDLASKGDEHYWADLRPVETITLEQILEKEGADQIDVLKLDCEGSEFSILENTNSLDRIGLIVGEYHNKERFHKLVKDRLAGWDLRVLKDGDLGTFWLSNPNYGVARQNRCAGSPCRAALAKRQAAASRQVVGPLLVAALRGGDEGGYDLLLLDNGQFQLKYTHATGQLRGFAHHAGKLWAIDSNGSLHHVHIDKARFALEKIASSPLAREAHDLTVVDGKLLTAGPVENAIVSFDPGTSEWKALRPWIAFQEHDESEPPTSTGDRHHVNSVAHDGEEYLLSLFSAPDKPKDIRWREAPLDQGLIVYWGRDGFADTPLARGIYAPHSLRLHDSRVWWCDSFRGVVRRDDGWQSPHLGGFTRGLRFVDGKCVVGLSKSRIDGNPKLDTCGVCAFDVHDPESRQVFTIDKPYIEIYDAIPLSERHGPASGE